MSLEKKNLESQLAIEQPFLKVPFESLSKSFRLSRKIIEKEIPSSTDKKLTLIKKKLSENFKDEEKFTKKLKRRIGELMSLEGSEEFEKFEKNRLNRLIVDYLLRRGFHESADLYLQKMPELEDLVDLDLFSTSRQIEESLLKSSCTECLLWCQENKGNSQFIILAALKKLTDVKQSDLEYTLREQEFIVLVKDGKLSDAIQYAKKYFPQFQQTHLKQIQRVMLLLAYTNKKDIVKQYYEPKRWQMLVEMFRKDFCQLYSLPSQPVLTIAIQSGLPALKTLMCNSAKNIHCPVCNYPFNELATNLPYAYHGHSCCVCSVTGEIMDENNSCMVLPNGNAYSLNGIKVLMKQYGVKNGDCQKFVDPRSGNVYSFESVKKAYLM